MSPKNIWKTSAVLSSIGIVLAIYLFYSYLSPNPSGLCDISPTVNCDAVTKGALAEILSIPVSLIGLIGYIFILYASLMRFKKLHLFMSTFGMIFCLRLTLLELLVEKVYCPVCLACQLIMLTLFIISLKLIRKPVS
ncbi:MAG: vitamin K epoxide reductase family protein [Candidatus Beckwithbacteria bacterium]